ncbi:lipopolysaccharide biosynthesis protein [Niabella hibiscisoli]|uniref:lipopolysaccharide biosynthesis protein n=1 Tax=Niabella hibiscisoli TaxID=1825928 RepID=UPI001F0D3CAE|nr:lipopolysaccharide biosynthesis protein [Niabella hibiscisoli]MCH5720421.1 lipopolysaccharide biosynthesis protein [Niabella hibiscisoli]
MSKIKNVHFLSLLGTGSISFVTFIFTAILFRSLSPEDCGVWFFFQTMLSFLDTFRQGFLNTAFVKFYAGASAERGRELIGSVWIIASAITLGFIIINLLALLFISLITDYSVVYFLKYFGINLLVMLPMIIGVCIVQGELRFDRLLYIRLFQVLLLIGFLVTLNLTHKISLTNLMYANIATSFLTSLLVIVMGWSGLTHLFRYTKKAIRELFHFGKYTVGTSISTNLFGVTDTLVLNFMLGPSAISLLNLGRRFMEVVEIPLRSFCNSALPSLAQYYNKGQKTEVIKLMQTFIGGTVIGLVPIVLITSVVAPFLISLVGGGQYIGTTEGVIAANILRISLILSFIAPVDRFLAITLDVIHKPNINFYRILLLLVVNFAIDVLGVYIWGNIYGVVLLGAVTAIISVMISYKQLQKHYLPFPLFGSIKMGYSFLVNLIRNNLFKSKNV